MMGDTINYYDLEFSLQSAFRAFDVKNHGSIDANHLQRALEYTDIRDLKAFLSFRIFKFPKFKIQRASYHFKVKEFRNVRAFEFEI